MKRKTLISSLIIFLLLLVCTNTEAYYQVIDLGTLGGDSSIAYSINDNGQIVGVASSMDSRYYQPTLFDPTGNGNNINLGTLGPLENEAWSINNSGQIAGVGSRKAVLYDKTGAGNNICLGTLGGSSSWAYAINDNGQIVGWAWTAKTCYFVRSDGGW